MLTGQFEIQVRTLTGLEALLADELVSLGALAVEPMKRMVKCQGDIRLVYLINLWSRLAIRVVVPIASHQVNDEKEFYQAVRSVDWGAWMRADGTLSVAATTHSSFSTHSLYLAQLTKDAVVDQFRETTGRRPSVARRGPQLQISIHLYRNRLQIGVDSSGDSLQRRGYRVQAGDAPLSEVLAAAVVKLSGWHRGEVLLDPFCGSGTLLIEAALMAEDRAPGLTRPQFGFEHWPHFQPELWQSLLSEAKERVRSSQLGAFFGQDCDESVLRLAKANASRAGVAHAIEFTAEDFFGESSASVAPDRIIANPPYDERMAVGNALEFYERMGTTLRRRFSSRPVALLSGFADAKNCLQLAGQTSLPLVNGKIDCELICGEAGSDTGELTDGSSAGNFADRAVSLHPEWQLRAEAFANRIRKNAKNLKGWIGRQQVQCYRLYDKDIPEIAYLVEVYGEQAVIAEVPRNHNRTPAEQAAYQELLLNAAAGALGFARDKIHFKTRQYEKKRDPDKFQEVREGKARYWVNYVDFVDSGLILEQRKVREHLVEQAKGKEVLNLYCGAGTLSVAAALGGAKSTTNIDSSTQYLQWAEENFRLNGLFGPHRFERFDVLDYLRSCPRKFDLAIVDPPQKSINRRTGEEFVLGRDAHTLLELVKNVIRPGGRILFCSQFKSVNLSGLVSAAEKPALRELTQALVSPDFSKRGELRVWELGRT